MTLNSKEIIKIFILALFLSSFIWLPQATLGQKENSEVDLIWSAKTYVPNNYTGKPLASAGSQVEVIAEVNNKTGYQSDLFFDWRINDQSRSDLSGIGKNTVEFTMNQSNVKIKIQVLKDDQVIGTDQTSIQLVKPEVLLYAKRNPFKTQSSFNFQANQKASLRVIPFFFKTRHLQFMQYQWALDSEIISQKDSKKNPHILNLEIGQLKEVIEKTLSITIEKDSQKEQLKTSIRLSP
mgnify:CR=1 FL=1